MSNKAGTCADWLRYQLELAQRNWEGQPSVGCLAMGDDQMLPRPLKGSDSFIPFGQGRDVVINSEDATKNERAAVDRVEKRACEYAGRQEVCAARAKRVRDRGNASRALSTLSTRLSARHASSQLTARRTLLWRNRPQPRAEVCEPGQEPPTLLVLRMARYSGRSSFLGTR